MGRTDGSGGAARQRLIADPVAVRLLAFDTVAKYTDLLVTLAEGKSATQVKSSAEQLRANLPIVMGLLGMAPLPGLATVEPPITAPDLVSRGSVPFSNPMLA